MTLLELQEEFRAQVKDEDAPYLWSDDEVFRYIVDAQDMYVRLIGGIADETVAAPTSAQLGDIPLVVGTAYAAVSPYILRFRRAKLVTGLTPILFSNQAGLRHLRTTHDDYGLQAFTEIFNDADKGEVVAAVLGIKQHQVRWWRVPAVIDSCRVMVFRLPLPRLVDTDDGSPQLEIDEQHHRHLLMWMKHLAYSKQDAEVYDKQAAAKNKEDFEAYCFKARQETERLRFRPRVVQFSDWNW